MRQKYPTMSPRPSLICQLSARLIDPSNKTNLQLKSHCNIIEKAHAVELEKARSQPSVSPPPQPQSPHVVSVDDCNDEFPQASTGPQVPMNKRSQATSESDDNQASNNDISVKIKSQERKKRQIIHTSELILYPGNQTYLSLVYFPEGNKTMAEIHVQDIDDDGPQKLNKS